MLRRIVRGLVVCGFAIVAIGAATHAEEKEPKNQVRLLKHKSPVMRQAVAPEGPVLKSRDELEKFVGGEASKELSEDVDFAEEVVVAMQYETGPPFGQPSARVKKVDGTLQVHLFVQAPDIGPNEVRGEALKLGLDFFAVPKGAEVKITPHE